MEITGFMGEVIAYREAQGEARGEAKARFGALKTLMRRHNWSADEAMDELEVSPKEREQLKKQLFSKTDLPLCKMD